jgi:hypothetical protein
MLRDMVRPVSLRLSNAAVIRRARLTVAQGEAEIRWHRDAKLAGLKALNACRRAFALDQATNQKFMPASEREHVRKLHACIEKELKRIAES